MTINYFEETETLANSRPLIIENDRTILSCSKGTSFPVVNTIEGQLFYHETQYKTYQLKTKTPSDTWVLFADLSGTPISQQTADARYAGISHNHAWDVNNIWLRKTGDTSHVMIYGNTRQMVFRTDGVTEYSGGVGTWAFLWMYGGDSLANRVFSVGAEGHVWSKMYGYLHDRFLSKNQSDTLVGGVGIYANNGAWSGDATTGKGKIQYHANAWYLNSAPESTNIAVFRQGGVDKLAIDANGYIYSAALGNYYHNLFAPRTSVNRPGVTKLYRREADDGYSVQTWWTGGRWRLAGFYADNNYHAECEVSYANSANYATTSGRADSAAYADYAVPRVLPTGTANCAANQYLELRAEGQGIRLYYINCNCTNCNCY